MGIVERKLSEIQLSTGQEIDVELNEAGKVHIHIDNIQIKLTRSEFVIFGNALEEGIDKLKEVKEEKEDG